MKYDRDYISYSGRRTYLICPSRYEKRYKEERFKKAKAEDALFGQSIGLVFEWFYSRALWRSESPKKAIENILDEALASGCKEYDFDPNSDPRFFKETKDEVLYYSIKGLEVIRKHRLLSPNSTAEDKLNVDYDDKPTGLKLRLGGRADFIHRFSPTDIWILDGKGSKWRDKYMDSDQLIWYALLHYLKFGVAPTRLGYIFWKFPEDPIKWVEYDSNSLREMAHSTARVVKSMKLNVFNTKPSKECKLCDFKDECDDGKKYLEEMDVKSKIDVTDSIFGFDVL